MERKKENWMFQPSISNYHSFHFRKILYYTTQILFLYDVALGVTQTRIRSKLYSEITKAMVELLMMNISRRVVKIMVENVINNILFMNIDE